jgi:DNA-binding IclR family transcriptional regulator
VTPGFASVAVAVRDHTGHPIAGLAVTFADGDVPDDVVRATQAAAAALARRV